VPRVAVATVTQPRSVRIAHAPLALALALVAAGHLLGARLEDADPRVHVGAPPLVGSFDLRADPRLLAAVGIAVAALAWAPRLTATLTWPRLLGTTYAVAAAWACALGWASGSLSAPLRSRYELLTAVPAAHRPGFLRGFVSDLPAYATHVRGHPPGGVLLLAGLDRIGLGGAGWAAVLCIAAGAAAAPLALVALRALGEEAAARGAAPFLALAPAAVWIATSMDALYLGVGALAVALAALRRPLAAGVVFGAGLMLSYGLAPLGLLLAVVARRDGVRVALGAGLVLALFAALGFWWLDGLRATHAQAVAGVLTRRPYESFLVINLAALALAAGPAAAASLRRSPHVLVAAALVAVAVTDLLGVTRGETERVWLPFVPWLLLGTRGLGRGWLAAQCGAALALQAGVRSPW
jgi:methylthioxylose transferase